MTEASKYENKNNARDFWRIFPVLSLLYLRQLLADPLVVLSTSGVEADGAARVHLAERHFLWRGAVVRLEGGDAEQELLVIMKCGIINNNCVRLCGVGGGKRCILHHLAE